MEMEADPLKKKIDCSTWSVNMVVFDSKAAGLIIV